MSGVLGPGPGGFGCIGRKRDLRSEVAKSAADTGTGSAARLDRDVPHEAGESKYLSQLGAHKGNGHVMSINDTRTKRVPFRYVSPPLLPCVRLFLDGSRHGL